GGVCREDPAQCLEDLVVVRTERLIGQPAEIPAELRLGPRWVGDGLCDEGHVLRGRGHGQCGRFSPQVRQLALLDPRHHPRQGRRPTPSPPRRQAQC
ncbi:hypothetical protein STRTUCAR8_00141, partial [Streptomyces turgidiscabies Car8]